MIKLKGINISLLLLLTILVVSCSKKPIVRKGVLQIVIDENAPSTVLIAANELKKHLQIVLEDEIIITRNAYSEAKKTFFIGNSGYTSDYRDETKQLKKDQFIIKSIGDSVFLLGNDDVFIPKFDFAPTFNMMVKSDVQWQGISKTKTRSPLRSIFKAFNKRHKLWEFDGRGSLNAVYSYLRKLGFEWYMAGRDGTLIPESITFPDNYEERGIPDFDMRFHYRYGERFFQINEDKLLWYLRLGLNRGEQYIGMGEPGHGISDLIAEDWVRKNHPEFFATIKGKRRNGLKGKPVVCLSSSGLMEFHIKFIRAFFDYYDANAISVMPPDAFTHMCECQLCTGKGTPERGREGQFSDYVWNYVNAVAEEIYKSHPDKKVTCFAYGYSLLAPETIEKFSPNVQIGICRNRANFNNQKTKVKYDNIADRYLELSERKLFTYDYYLNTRPNRKLENVPVYIPSIIQEDLRNLKDKSIGELIEVHTNYADSESEIEMLVNHLNVFITSRLYWDVDLDIEKLMKDYFNFFYKETKNEMEAFYTFCENNWMKMTEDGSVSKEALELLEKASRKAKTPSVSNKINLLHEYIKPLSSISVKKQYDIEKQRVVRVTRSKPQDILLDGKLNENIWNGIFAFPMYYPKEYKKNKWPSSKVKFSWSGNTLFIGIINYENDLRKLRKKYNKNIIEDDHIKVVLNTLSGNEYEVVVSPDGKFETKGLDRESANNIRVFTNKGKEDWTVEVAIPINTSRSRSSNFQLSGRFPTEHYPWYFNIYRTRYVDNKPIIIPFAGNRDNISYLENRSKLTIIGHK